MNSAPNGPFYLLQTPKPKDRHKYNAFGILIGFGKAYSAFYHKLDKPTPRKRSKKSSTPSRQNA